MIPIIVPTSITDNSTVIIQLITQRIPEVLTNRKNTIKKEHGEMFLKKMKETNWPIYKKGSREEVVNYRPVSLMTSFSKIFETLLKSGLDSFIRKNKLQPFRVTVWLPEWKYYPTSLDSSDKPHF